MKNDLYDYLNSCANQPFDAAVFDTLLMKNPAWVTQRVEDGETCLHQAAQWHLPEAAKKLMAQGADVNALSNDGWAPSHDCALPNSIYQLDERVVETMQVLLAHGADTSLSNNQGESAADYAKRTQFDRALQYLFEHREDSLVGHPTYQPEWVGKVVSIETKANTNFVFMHTGQFQEFGKQFASGKLLRYTNHIHEAEVSTDMRASNCLLVLDIWPDDFYYIHIDDIESLKLAQ